MKSLICVFLVFVIYSVFCQDNKVFFEDNDIKIENGNSPWDISIYCKNPFVLNNFTFTDMKVTVNKERIRFIKCYFSKNFRVYNVVNGIGFKNVQAIGIQECSSELKRHHLIGLHRLYSIAIKGYNYKYLDADLLQDSSKLIQLVITGIKNNLKIIKI